MSFFIFESILNSRIHHKNLKSLVIYEHYFNFIFWSPSLAVLVNKKSEEQTAVNIKIFRNLHQRWKVITLYVCSDTLNGKNDLGKYMLHCSGIDPFVT